MSKFEKKSGSVRAPSSPFWPAGKETSAGLALIYRGTATFTARSVQGPLRHLAPAGERGCSSLSIGILNIDSQSALPVVVCAGLGAVALALGIVSPELRLRRGFGAGAPSQRGRCRGQEQDAEHTKTLRRAELAV